MINSKKMIVTVVLSLVLGIMTVIPVSADEVYFENQKGLKLNKTQYDELLEIVDETVADVISMEEYQYLMLHKDESETSEMYYKTTRDVSGNTVNEGIISEEEIIDEINCKNVPVSDVRGRGISTYAYDPSRRTATLTTEYKHITLRLYNISPSSKTATIKCEWLKIPAYKSYDVLGFRVIDKSLILNTPTAKNVSGKQSCNGGKLVCEYNGYSNNIKKCNSGIGISMNIFDDAKSDLIMEFTTIFACKEKKIAVWGSYQHCQSNISLSKSKRYDIQGTGMGDVFLFDSSVGKYYDHTPGLMAAAEGFY